MTRTEFPWQPTQATDREMVACVNFSPTPMYGYVEGFVQGADALYKALQADRAGQDLLIYPLVFNLRHALELALKQVILCARILLDEEDRTFPHGHDLVRLWSIATPLLKRIWPDDGTEPGYEITERTIEAFRSLDPTGESFRYPVRMNQSASLDPDLRQIDLDQMYGDAKVTLDLLTGADAGIDHYLDLKHDMEAELRAINAEMRAEYEEYYESENERDDDSGWI